MMHLPLASPVVIAGKCEEENRHHGPWGTNPAQGDRSTLLNDFQTH
jgi:hypothetical protein